MAKRKQAVPPKSETSKQSQQQLQTLQIDTTEPRAVSYPGQLFDRALHAWMSKFIGWLSPASFSLALFNWIAHLSISPAKQADLIHKAWQKYIELYNYVFHCNLIGGTSTKPCIEKRTPDPRFQNELWQQYPFNIHSQGFLLCQQWWDAATSHTRGVARHHEHVVNFTARQMLDIFSPSNFALTNPEVLQNAYKTGGVSLMHGMQNFWDDLFRQIRNEPPAGAEQFVLGKNIAITPGKVVYRNELIELIQYEPTTSEVFAEPILIIPAWIMKYYILDLSPHNSLVKYLVNKGHTVFMISWKNPTSKDRELGIEDYLNLGIMDALAIINEIIPNRKIHTVGYCLGGTLLMIAAAAMAPKNDNRIKSITLLAAQVDFRDAGELLLFVDESQITYLEDIMWAQGFLDGSQMSGAFSMLHSNNLIWSRMIHDYLLGVRRPMNDLVAWDHDTTRLPFRMHSQYLRSLFLNNELVEGRFKVQNKKIALKDITAPIFAVGTIKDHISPWRSVYKIHLFTNTDITFVLTNGGHNAGIVSEPGHAGRHFQMDTRSKTAKYITSEHWLEKAPGYEGSWWIEWQEWLAKRSSGKGPTPHMGDPTNINKILGDAPGTYVFEK